MKTKLINSQLSNFKTYEMYKRQLLTLAENVFEYKNMPEFIDTSFLNKVLLRQGAIAFFKDEVMGLLALPFHNMGKLDVYGRPTSIQVISQNGYSKVIKNRDDFVIMYDNNGRYPLWLDVCAYAERIALDTRTIDINIAQQTYPRILLTDKAQELSMRNLANQIDDNVLNIFADRNLRIYKLQYNQQYKLQHKLQHKLQYSRTSNRNPTYR